MFQYLQQLHADGHIQKSCQWCSSLLRYPGLRQPEVEACDLALPTREDLKLIEETREEKVIVMLMLVIMMER